VDKKMRQSREKVGIVSSNSGDKTIRVEVSTRRPHKQYHKVTSRKRAFLVHDEKNIAKKGDQVSIKEVRPLSGKKRWAIIEVREEAWTLEKE